MAKTAADYFNDGVAMFAENKARPDGTSWQAKAMRNGWDKTKSLQVNTTKPKETLVDVFCKAAGINRDVIEPMSKIASDVAEKLPNSHFAYFGYDLGSEKIADKCGFRSTATKMRKISNDAAKNFNYLNNRMSTLFAVKAHIKHLEMLADAECLGSPKFHRYVNKIEKLEAKYHLA